MWDESGSFVSTLAMLCFQSIFPLSSEFLIMIISFPLLLSANSENNKKLFERVIQQVLHGFGGQEKCPWTRNVMEGNEL